MSRPLAHGRAVIGQRSQAGLPAAWRWAFAALIAGALLATPLYLLQRRDQGLGSSVVVQVDETRYTLAEYVDRLYALQVMNQEQGKQLDLAVEPFLLLTRLQEEAILLKAAPAFGGDVSPSDIDRSIRERVLPTPVPRQAFSEDEVQRLYRQRLARLGLSDETYRRIVRAELLRARVRAVLAGGLPPEQASALNAQEREAAIDTALQAWFREQRALHQVAQFFDSEKYAWAMDQLRQRSATPPRPAQ